MNEQLTPELLAQAHTAETPDALLALAKEHGIALTPEEARIHFNWFRQTGEVSDEELENVAGGASGGDEIYDEQGRRYTETDYFCFGFKCKKCGIKIPPIVMTRMHVCRYNIIVNKSRCYDCVHFLFNENNRGVCTK